MCVKTPTFFRKFEYQQLVHESKKIVIHDEKKNRTSFQKMKNDGGSILLLFLYKSNPIVHFLKCKNDWLVYRSILILNLVPSPKPLFSTLSLNREPFSFRKMAFLGFSTTATRQYILTRSSKVYMKHPQDTYRSIPGSIPTPHSKTSLCKIFWGRKWVVCRGRTQYNAIKYFNKYCYEFNYCNKYCYEF